MFTLRLLIVFSLFIMFMCFYYYHLFGEIKMYILGRGCNRSHILQFTSMAQWSTRINQVIFAILDVS